MKKNYTLPLIFLLMAFIILPRHSFPNGDIGTTSNPTEFQSGKVSKTDTIPLELDQSRDVLDWYKGWVGDPDSISVHIGSNFTDAQKAEIQTAIDRWNAAGCVPALKVVTTSPAKVNITRNDSYGGGGETTLYGNPATGEVSRADIEIDTDGHPGTEALSVAEIATHELGHALGLDHTDNADDAMKAKGTNGNDGALSDEDKAELKRAGTQALAWMPPDGAESPAYAMFPGESQIVSFDLVDYLPPNVLSQTEVQVNPFFDELLFVTNATIELTSLNVGVVSDQTHPNSTMYLRVDLYPPPPYEPVSFLGYHFIHNNPAQPTTFECPFEVHQESGTVHVEWTHLCTYPYENDLRSKLVVDNSITQLGKNHENYSIQLSPGNHTLQLFVDDYQVNSASYAMDITVEATALPWEEPFEIYPLGSDIVGQGGWEFWFGGATSPSARVTDDQVHAGEQALAIRGMEDLTGDDIVHQFSGATSGVWEICAWQFIPTAASGGTTYFVLLNQYGNTLEECNWSTQIKFDPDLNIVESEGEGATLPLVKGQWAKISIVVDLDRDQQTISYNGQVLSTKSWTGGVSGGGIADIAAIDLWSNNLANARVFYDDMSIQPYLPTTKYWLPFDTTPEGTPPDVEILQGDDFFTNFNVKVHGLWVTEIVEDGQVFHKLELPDYTTTNDPGKAALPTIRELLGVISGAQEVEIGYIEIINSMDFSGFNVYPYQTDLNEDSVRIFEYDPEFYSTDMYYPGLHGETGNLNSWHVVSAASVMVYPFSYNPLLQQLVANTEMEIQLLHQGEPVLQRPHFTTSHIWYNNYASTFFNASLILPSFSIYTSLKGNYLIITGDDYYNSILPLANWKKQKGYNVTITKASTLGSPLTSTAVYNHISTFYSNSGSNDVYVLLVGDVGSDPLSEIPIYTGYPGIFGYDLVSDYYYSCMGGIFDVYADLFLGRLSVEEDAEVDGMVDVILNYEKTPVIGNWVKKVLLAAHKEDYPGKYTNCSEEIRTYGYSVTTPTFDTQYGGAGGTNAGVTSAINSGRGIVNYRGHGSSTTWSHWDAGSSSYTTSMVSGLSNGSHTPLVYSISCWNNRIDYSSNCIGEVWMKQNKAVSHFSATRPSSTSRNHELDKYLFKATFDNGIYHQGAVNNWARAQILSDFGTGDASAVGNSRMYLLLGEPEMEIHTKTLQILAPAHANSIRPGPQSFTVAVADATGGVLSGALVCLWKGSEVFVNAYTNAAGLITLNINPTSAGTMLVTATKHDYIPYQDSVDVTQLMDFGDAPDDAAGTYSYKTLLGNDGARHAYEPGVLLGTTIDWEVDGKPSPAAVGDDNNPSPTDEDGVQFLSSIVPGQTATVEVIVSATGYLNAWLDFDIDYDWVGEQIFTDTLISGGVHTLKFSVPASAITGTTFARFRFATYPGLTSEGLAENGEVEDYLIEIVDSTDRCKMHFVQWPDLTTNGMDVYCMDELILADDFRCEESGYITDIHIWGSWLNDEVPVENPPTIILGIWSDNPQGQNEHSEPNTLLCEYTFEPDKYTMELYASVPDGEWFYRPDQSVGQFPGDWSVYKYSFYIPEADACIQEEGKIYWLSVNVLGQTTGDNQFGWKTSMEQFNDFATWEHVPVDPPWNMVCYPYNHPKEGSCTDMAFYISGHPDTTYADVWIKDCDADVGTVPSTPPCTSVCQGPDIWIDNDSDGIMDAPVVGAVNRLYIRARNLGPATATNVTASLYYRNSSTGLSFPTGANYIGNVSPLVIPAGGTAIGWVPWTVPAPPTYGHWCIGGIVTAPYDPQTFETSPDDNNVCFVNIWALYNRAGDPIPPKDAIAEPVIVDFLVRNPYPIIDFFVLDAENDLPGGWLTEFFVDEIIPVSIPYTLFLIPQQERLIRMVVTPGEDAQHGDGGTVIVKQYGENYPSPEALVGDITYPIAVDLYKPDSITDLEAVKDGIRILLQWTPVTTDVSGGEENIACYNVYRGDTPDFEPGMDNRIGRVAVDENEALAGFQWYDENPKGNIYYIVRVEDEAGYESGNSNLGIVSDGCLLPTGWEFVVTGQSHIISIPLSANPNIFGDPLDPDDWIGVFYLDDDGKETCGGAVQWNGISNVGVNAYGDDPITPEKDGFDVGERFRWRMYDCSTFTEHPAGASYDESKPNEGYFADLGLSSLTSLEVMVCQFYSFTTGWNSISSYITPFTPGVEDLFSPVVDDMIILRNLTQFYWPDEDLNTIGNWDNGSGYALKMKADTDFEICGADFASNEVMLETGWFYLPALSQCSVDAMELFGNNLDDIVIVQDLIGTDVFWPVQGVYSLDTIDPGKAYKIKVANPFTVTFPGCDGKATTPVFSQVNSIHTVWGEVNMTPSTGVVAFMESVTDDFRKGDVIGVFGQNNQLFGYMEVAGAGFAQAITLFGDDVSTDGSDGFVTDEIISFILHRPSTGEMFDLDVEYDPSLDDSGVFSVNSLSAVTGVTLTGIDSPSGWVGSKIRIFPNPSPGIFNIEGLDGEAEISIFNAFGDQIVDVKNTLLDKVDLSGQPKGIYIIRISTKDGVHFEKLVIN